jgi:hypothetical protein
MNEIEIFLSDNPSRLATMVRRKSLVQTICLACFYAKSSMPLPPRLVFPPPITPAKRPTSLFLPRRKRTAQFPFQLNASSGSPIFQRWRSILTVPKMSQKWPVQICAFLICGKRPAITCRGATPLPVRLLLGAGRLGVVVI